MALLREDLVVCNWDSDLSIMQQTHHRTLGMIARYRKPTSLFQDNAATKLGL